MERRCRFPCTWLDRIAVTELGKLENAGYARVSAVDQDPELQTTALITVSSRSHRYSMP